MNISGAQKTWITQTSELCVVVAGSQGSREAHWCELFFVRPNLASGPKDRWCLQQIRSSNEMNVYDAIDELSRNRIDVLTQMSIMVFMSQDMQVH